MHYLIYKITNTKNGNIYIGCHQTTNPNDGYMGSGTVLRRAVKKHGVGSFTKEILYDFSSVAEMFDKEKELVNEEFVARADTYNIKVGGSGGWDYVNRVGINPNNMTVDIQTLGTLEFQNLNLDHKWNKNRANKISIGLKKYIKKHGPFWGGKTHSAKSKKIISDKAKERFKDPAYSPTYGKKWMTDGINSKPVAKEDQDKYLTDGWRYGRVIYKETS